MTWRELFLPFKITLHKPRNSNLPLKLQHVGDHIRKVRVERGLSQADVAREIGVIEQSITNWENNHGQPQIRYYPAIIGFLGYYPFDHNYNLTEGKIAILRHCLGVSYKGLGTILFVNGSTVRAWEQATHSSNRTTALKIDSLISALPEFIKKQYCS
ncbi:MAG: helix-turn-helix transcriptional regulator [Bacteroidetes bacterium]|nr:helix-turn-helix transcriptional regulator [Bacteroidota bacterium]